MATFAEINAQGIVLRVLVVDDSLEVEGETYLANTLGLGGEWVKCSETGAIRKQFPGRGYKYDRQNGVFITPSPYPSWKLDKNHDWKAPKAKPNNGNRYEWNEDRQDWDVV